MTVNDYIQQRFQSFGITLSEADLLDIVIGSNTAGEADVTQDNIQPVSIGIARFIPSLLLRATAIKESGFSISWDMDGIKEYYAYLCKKYGLKDELNTDKPRVTFIQ